MLTVFATLVMLLPARFVLPALGGAGTPAVTPVLLRDQVGIPVAHILHAEGAGNDEHLAQRVMLPGGQDHASDARIQRQTASPSGSPMR